MRDSDKMGIRQKKRVCPSACPSSFLEWCPTDKQLNPLHAAIDARSSFSFVAHSTRSRTRRVRPPAHRTHLYLSPTIPHTQRVPDPGCQSPCCVCSRPQGLGGSPTYICIWLIIKTIPSAATMTCMGCILSDHPVEETRHMLMSDPSLVMACHCHFSTPDHDARSPTALRHCLPQSESFTD